MRRSTRTWIATCAVAALTLGSGCVTMQQRMGELEQSYAGRPVIDAVSRWGPPAKQVTTPDGSAVYEWRDRREGGLFCRWWFTVDKQGTIQRMNWEGNNC